MAGRMSDSNFDAEFDLEQMEHDFRRVWEEGAHRPDIKQLLAGLNRSQQIELLKVLIPVDIQFRIGAGETVDSNTYSRFGDSAVSIAEGFRLRMHPKTDFDRFATIVEDVSSARTKGGGPVYESVGVHEELIDDRYRLLHKIGHGGMGSVWLARQEHPVKREVAVKIINNTLGSREAVARFAAERQALAMMDHPNIARVLDGGTTDDGRPFFVMELVRGVPITDYCHDQKLNNHDRLRLILPICEAIQHAHEKGIIHRDLKPSNILVTTQDGRPTPKVIDFGLAKALEKGPRLTDETIVTEHGRVVGTLQYMSPEQAGYDALDIDTRTDVYSVGVLLYQLLTDIVPLEQEDLSGKYLIQIVEIICHAEIPRPSVAIARDSEDLKRAGGNRNTDPIQLSRNLRGELDWIVLKALQKDRDHRYQTASGVAADIQRYLNREPVAARPPSKAYLLKKMLRKYQSLVTVILSAAVLLLIFASASVYFAVTASRYYHEAKGANDRAERAKATAGNYAFVLLSLMADATGTESTSDWLKQAESRMQETFQDDPETHAEFLFEMSEYYLGNGDYESACDAFATACELEAKKE